MISAEQQVTAYGSSPLGNVRNHGDQARRTIIGTVVERPVLIPRVSVDGFIRLSAERNGVVRL
jgi:hypothetical protein